MGSRPKGAAGCVPRLVGRILRRPRAEEDLLEIWTFVAQGNLDAADRLLDRIGSKLRLLAERPLIGRDRSELADAIRSFSVDNYVLFYRVGDEGIELVRVRSRYLDLNPADFAS